MVTWSKQTSLQRLSVFTAATLGMAAATGDPTQMPSNNTPSAGSIYFVRTYVDQALSCNTMYTWVLTAGATLTNCYLGVYDAKTGNQLAKTADISSKLTTTGAVTAALTAALSGLACNQEIYLALLIGSGTAPQLLADRQYGVNLGMSSDYRLQVSATSGYTALPATVPALQLPASAASQFLALGP